MQFGRAIGSVAIASILFGAIGMAIGYLIGSFMPGYYRSVFVGGDSPDFDPLTVGIGQGLTQGVVLGAAVGLILVLASWWKEAKLAELAQRENRAQERATAASVSAASEEEVQNVRA